MSGRERWPQTRRLGGGWRVPNFSQSFLSRHGHSSRDMREAVALKRWLAEQDPPLANEIFLDVDPDSGLQAGTRWKDALRRANARCEAVVCLLSANWEASRECMVEYRTAENLNKQIFVVRLEPSTGDDLTSEWQRCDLFGEGPKTQIDVGGGVPVELGTEGLYRLRDGIRGAGIGADSFVWPSPGDPSRAPYRGWEPLEETDAAVFFGRDAQIVRAMDAMRGMRRSEVNSLFVVLGPSGTGKSSFLRAGLLPRLRREDRRFVLLDIVRPERNALTGEAGLAQAVCATRERLGLTQPSLGNVKAACTAGDVAAIAQWLSEIRSEAASRLVDRGSDGEIGAAPTLVLPLDQAEELFTADAAGSADKFLRLVTAVLEQINASEVGLLVAATIRTDRYEVMQTHPLLAGVGTVLFDELKPMPPTQFKEVIAGPAQRASDAGQSLTVAPDLVERLLADAAEGADTLPMLALVLSRLYTDYGSTGELTLAHYEALGGMRQVVQCEVDEVLATDPQQRAAELETLRAAFIPWLATINPDNDQPLRRVAAWSDLPEASRPLIDALVAKRLMVKDTRGGQTVVEVALESLLRQWDELADWLREQRHDLKAADDLERSSGAWVANDEDPAWLLAGSRLTDAETLFNTTGFRQRLVGASDFLAASREVENQRLGAEEEQRQSELCAAQERQATAEAHNVVLRKRSRVLRTVLALTAVVAVVAAVGFVRANAASNEATRQFEAATSQRLTTESQAMLAGTRPGGEVRAIQELLAANALATSSDRNAMYDAVIETAVLRKIISMPSMAYNQVFSPDGQLIAAGGTDDTVRLWDVGTGQPHGEPLAGHEDLVGGVAFSPDGQLLASSSNDGTVRLWDVDSGQPVGEPITGPGEKPPAMRSVWFSADGQRVITRNADGVLQIWSVQTGRPVGEPVITGVSEAVFSGVGKRLAVAGTSAPADIVLWDTAINQKIGDTLRGHTEDVHDLAFSANGKMLASAGQDKTVRLWDAGTGLPIGGALAGHTGEVFRVTFSPDGNLLASGAADGTVRLWNPHTGQPIGKPLIASGLVIGLAFSPDGKQLTASTSLGVLRIWSVPHALPLAAQALAFSPDARRLAGGTKDGTLRIWDSQSAESIGPPMVVGKELANLDFSPDGQRLAVTGVDGLVEIRDATSGAPLDGPYRGLSGAVLHSAFSPDGRYLVAGDVNGVVQVWDTENGEVMGPPHKQRGFVVAVGFNRDGSQVVAVHARDNGSSIGQWDVATGARTSSTSFLILTAAALGPDRMAVGGADGTVGFLKGESFDESLNDVAAPVTGHDGPVSAMAYSPDGHRMVSGSRDAMVRLWDADTGTTIGRAIPGLANLVGNVALSPDARLLAAADLEGSARIWPATARPEDLCAKLTTNMSEKQWGEWVSPEIDYIKTCPDLPVAPD